jgi:uncharacterized membrane protein YfcA
LSYTDLFTFELSFWQISLMVFSALLIGMSKTGISGAGMAMIPIMAAIFGGKLSTGIVLPMLSMADIFAVSYYHRHASWSYIIRLMPTTVVGILIGIYVGDIISDQDFKDIMGIIVMLSVGILVWRDIRKDARVPGGMTFPFVMGLAGGFATMVGNAAGAIMALYLLSMRLPKNVYIGTGAWFFLIINLFKIPFHIFVWGTISLQTVTLDFLLLPAIATGAFLGILIVKYIPERAYRIFLLVTTALTALVLIIK